MPCTPEMFTRTRTDVTRTKQLPPDVLTYRYASRMAYVAPVEDYDKAIDVAVRSFSDLRRFKRDRIYLEVHVVPSDQHEKKAVAKIDRTVWPIVVATLSRFDIVDIHVAPPHGGAHKVTPNAPPKAPPDAPLKALLNAPPNAPPKVAAASSSALPPPYSEVIGSQSHVPYRPSEPQPHAPGLHITMELISSESSPGYIRKS